MAARPADDLADRAAVVVLAVAALIAALTFRDYGLGWDDYTHSQYGDLLLKLYLKTDESKELSASFGERRSPDSDKFGH